MKTHKYSPAKRAKNYVLSHNSRGEEIATVPLINNRLRLLSQRGTGIQPTVIITVLLLVSFAWAKAFAENVDFDKISFEKIKERESDMSSDGIKDIHIGSVFIYKTNELRYGKMLIKKCGENLVIKWVTYDDNDSARSEGDSLSIPNRGHCDLDSGRAFGFIKPDQTGQDNGGIYKQGGVYDISGVLDISGKKDPDSNKGLRPERNGGDNGITVYGEDNSAMSSVDFFWRWDTLSIPGYEYTASREVETVGFESEEGAKFAYIGIGKIEPHYDKDRDSNNGERPERNGGDNGLTGYIMQADREYYSIQTYTDSDRYIRHRNGQGEASKIMSESDSDDATFKIVPGLADQRYVSFEPLNHSDHFLIHENREIWLRRRGNDNKFMGAATWKKVPGLANKDYVSFESYDKPGFYIALNPTFSKLYLYDLDPTIYLPGVEIPVGLMERQLTNTKRYSTFKLVTPPVEYKDEIPKIPPFKIISGRSWGDHPGGGDIKPYTVAGLKGYENATVFLKGFSFSYKLTDHNINEIGLKLRDVNYNREEGFLTWNAEFVFGDGGDSGFDDDFSWHYEYIVLAYNQGSCSQGHIVVKEAKRSLPHLCSHNHSLSLQKDKTVLLPTGFRFDFVGKKNDYPNDLHINEFGMAFSGKSITGEKVHWASKVTYADKNFDDPYFWETDYRVFSAPGIVVKEGVVKSSCDGGRDRKEVHTGISRQENGLSYDFATVLLMGWKFDFLGDNVDNCIQVIKIAPDNEFFDRPTNVIKWDAAVAYRDKNRSDGDDAYDWEFWYSIVGFNWADVSKTPPVMPLDDLPVRLAFLDGGKTVKSNIPIFGGRDDDGDGLNDYWEDEALRQLNPYFVLDEEEAWINHRHEHAVVNFVRVAPYPSLGLGTPKDKQYILFTYVVAWAKDYGYGMWGKTNEHNGDIERVVMAWKVLDKMTIELYKVSLSAHGKNPVTNADKLTYSPTGPIKVFCAEHKHAIFHTSNLENLHSVEWYEPLPEDLGGGGTFRFPAYNVGEPTPYERLKITALDEYGFEGERIEGIKYNDEDKFCGGLGCNSNSPGPILEKLYPPTELTDQLPR